MDRPYDLRERAFLFAVETVRFSKDVAERGYVMRRLAGQLVDAAGSVGANLQEGKSGQTKPDFVAKYFVSLKEARESPFWLRLIAASEPDLQKSASQLTGEASELVAILTACIKTAKSRKSRGKSDT
jgi:four helix bundle protein